MEWSKLAKNTFVALVVSGITGLMGVMLGFFTVHGGVDYSMSHDNNSNYITFNAYNGDSQAMDLDIWVSDIIESRVSSSGNASISILAPAGRQGNVIHIGEIPANSYYTLIVTTHREANPPNVSLLKAPNGVGIGKDIVRKKFDLIGITIPALVQFILLSAFFYLSDRYMARRQRQMEERIDQMRQELDTVRKNGETIKIDLQKERAYFTRLKFYYGMLLRQLRRETEFWHICFRSFITASGGSKPAAFTALSVIAKRLGLKDMPRFDEPRGDDDLDALIDILVQEDKRTRFSELLSRAQSSN